MDNDRQTTAEISALNTPTSARIARPRLGDRGRLLAERLPQTPYARADRSYEYYRSAYRYGTERATQWQGREWGDAEPDLSDAWPKISDATSLPWDDIREAVRDAWDRVRGKSQDDQTHIR